MITKGDLLEEIEGIERWLSNVSAIQNQLLRELGYKIKYKAPTTDTIYIEKVKVKEEAKK